MKSGSKIFRGIGLITLALIASSCRDFSVDGGRSNLTCAASSVSAMPGAELYLLDPSLGGNELAQTFKVQATVKNIKSIALGLQLVSVGPASPSGNLYVSIVGADSNGYPDIRGAALATSMQPVSKVSTTPQAVTFTFGAPIAQLTANTTYGIILSSTSMQWNPNARIAWVGTDNNSYPDGQALAYNGLGWLNPDANKPDPTNRRDLSFQIGCL